MAIRGRAQAKDGNRSRWIRLVHAVFVELRTDIDVSDPERGRLLDRGNRGFHRLKTRPIKISAERAVYCQRNNQSEPQPAAFSAASEQAFGLESLKILEIGKSHYGLKISHLDV